MTPARFEAKVLSGLRDLVTGKATEDQVTAAICADADDLAAWWIEQAYNGQRFTVSGEPVEMRGGAA